MGLSSLRLRALGAIQGVLRRWLDLVDDQLEPADQPPTPPAREPFVSRRPAPPAHWVERVRHSAPQLLTPVDTSDDGTVIDYRASDAPPTFPPFLPPAQPLSLVPARPLRPPVHPPVSATTSSRRPLRLEPVRTQLPAADTLVPRSTDVTGAAVTPPTISTEAPPFEGSRGSLTQADAALIPLPTHRTASVANTPEIPLHTRERSTEANPVWGLSTPSGARELIASHFAALPDEPSLNSASTSVPQRTDIPVVHTREGGRSSLTQQRTNVPQTSQQVTVRPTSVPPSLNIEDIQPERWPSLPESPADDMPDSRSEDRRRERLLREQEGRSWNE